MWFILLNRKKIFLINNVISVIIDTFILNVIFRCSVPFYLLDPFMQLLYVNIL